MSYDERLVDRVRARLGSTEGITELVMFGGWGATVHGNMSVGVLGDDLIVRVGKESYDAALDRAGARPFDFTGRPMTGWVYVAGSALRNARTLAAWVDAGVNFARSLPPKRRAPQRPAQR